MEGLHALGLHGNALNQALKTKIAKSEGDFALDIRDNAVLVSTSKSNIIAYGKCVIVKVYNGGGIRGNENNHRRGCWCDPWPARVGLVFQPGGIPRVSNGSEIVF